MTTHLLHASQFIARPIDEVFAFFARPENLARITPGSMRFEFVSSDLAMRDGLEIDYRLRPLFRVAVGWRMRIVGFNPPRGFADIQLSGPHRRWEHAHEFTEVEGGTRVDDRITYELPLGPLGELVHLWLVRPELERVFSHRARTIEAALAPLGENDAPLTVVVAGGTGFVGGAIAQALYRRGHRVSVMSRRGDAARGDLPDGVAIHGIDVTLAEDLPETLAGADALVISLAFKNSPMEAPRRGWTFEVVDAVGTERLVAAAKDAGVRQILYISGAGAAPDAPHHWFRAKWRAEEAVRGSRLAWTIIRPTWIYGPRDVSLNRFMSFARRLPIVPMTNTGRQLLAPVFVDDVADLAADSLTDPQALGQVFEIGGPEALPMREIIRRALDVAGLRRPIVPGPAPLIKLMAAPLTVLPDPPLTPDAVDFINQPAVVDTGPLLARMPRRLTPLEEGLASYLQPGSGPGSLEVDGRSIATRQLGRPASART